MKKVPFLILMSLALVLCACQKNPVEGKWELAEKDDFLNLFGCGSLEFTSSRMFLCGKTDRVEYEIDGNRVVVISSKDDYMTFYMNGKNQMYLELPGEKLYWNRVK